MDSQLGLPKAGFRQNYLDTLISVTVARPSSAVAFTSVAERVMAGRLMTVCLVFGKSSTDSPSAVNSAKVSR